MLVKLAHGNGRTFVINPSPMVCRYSDDLVSWRDVVLPLASGETIYNIAYGNNKWIITTSLGNLLISTNNGTTWEKELSIFGVVNGRISIAVLEHVWVMVLPGKNVALSTDNANSWFFDPNFIIPNVSSSNYGKIEKEGNDVILYSEDGFNVGNNALRIRIRRVLPNIEDAANTKVYIRVTK